MIELTRAEMKSDPNMNKVFEAIKRSHEVAEHTEKTLYENRNTKDFCVIARHYAVIPPPPSAPKFFLHYDTANWYGGSRALIKIETVAFYDTEAEYMTARLKGLHSTSKSEGINFN